MKKLEFLLQKEGDRAWLPLETPDVEILEGKYRVVARIQHPNTDIEIRVTHTSFDEPAQRKVQSRSARTNPEGLVVIIPYTRLKPGLWELSCLPDPKSTPAKPWQYGVQLEVLPAESETSEPLPPIDQTEPAASPSHSKKRSLGRSSRSAKNRSIGRSARTSPTPSSRGSTAADQNL